VSTHTIGAMTGAGTGDLQWVTDAFTVALVGAVLSAARLHAGAGYAAAVHACALTLIVLLLGAGSQTTPSTHQVPQKPRRTA
jgi:hypothetical protein